MKSSLLISKYFFKHWKGCQNHNYRGVNLHKNYYKILSLSSNASHDEIKKRYFKLAKQLHPDINPSGQAKFTEVQEAYNILSNQQFRRYYNDNSQFGSLYTKTQKKDKQQKTDYRNQQFYEQMKRKGYQDFDEKQYEEYAKSTNNRSEEQSQEQKAKKKIDDQIQFARRLLFSRNPIWQQANAYMNYQQRHERQVRKQKQIEAMFPKASKIFGSFKNKISKY